MKRSLLALLSIVCVGGCQTSTPPAPVAPVRSSVLERAKTMSCHELKAEAEIAAVELQIAIMTGKKTERAIYADALQSQAALQCEIEILDAQIKAKRGS